MTQNNSPTRLPEVLLDAVTVGLQFDIPADAVTPFIANLRRADLLTRGTDAHRLVMSVPLGDKAELGHARVELTRVKGHPGRFGNMSKIQVNGLRILRADLQGAERWGESLDGSDNFIGPMPNRVATLFLLQMDLMAFALHTVAAAIDEAVPEGSTAENVKCWLKAAEACFDMEVADAQAVMKRLRRSAFPGQVTGCLDWYRASAKEEDGHLAVRYWRQAKGPCFKIYAKTAQLLRVEIACVDRRALSMMKCTASAAYVDAETARTLLQEFAQLATPLLAELRSFAVEAIGGLWSVDELLVALSPLLELRRGNGTRRGRAPEEPARRGAAQAIESLLTSGTFNAEGFRVGHALKRVLDELSTPTGPLVRVGRRAIYCLHPKYASAAASIAA